MRLVKGHGTENDFLVLPDLDGTVALTAGAVRALCDRHAGLGADGILRLVRSVNDPQAQGMAADAEFFMDYRNADGSVAEMCGNGIRVLMRYLLAAGLVEQEAAVATRGGVRRVRADADGFITVDMGPPRILADRPIVTAACHCAACSTTRRPSGATVEMPNPHVVVWVDSERELADLDLRAAPGVTPSLPSGQNVEFAWRRPAPDSRRLVMRVHERGSGETRSCGTGICAVAVAAASADGAGADGARWQVDVPGGTCEVVWDERGVHLRGPAVLIADLQVDEDWLAGR